MLQLQTPKGVLHYDEQGSGEPLLLLHANPGDPRDFDAIAPALARHYRVLRLAWPGYGGAPAPQPPEAASAMLYAELLQAFVTALDLRGLRIIGNSVGAYAALRLALAAPQRVSGLVLVAPGGFTAHNRWTRLLCRLKGSERLTRWLNGPMAWLYLRLATPVVQAMRARARGEQREPAAVAVNAALWRSFVHPDHDLRAAAAAVVTPTLVLAGRRDPLIPVADAARASRLVPGAGFIVLPCGHAPFAEMPEAFLAAVLPFLQRGGEESAAPVALAASG